MNTFKTTHKPLAALLLTTFLLQGCHRDNADAGDAQTKVQEYINRAETYRHQGQYRAAIIEGRNALQKDPKDRAAIAELASIFNELGQGKTALKMMEPLAADANRDEALIIARAYFLQHKYQSALDYMTATAARLPSQEDEATALLRAQNLIALGQTDSALNILTSIANPHLSTQLEIVRAQRLHGDTETSQTRIAELLQKNPDSVEVLSEAAGLAEQQGQLDQAEDMLSKALISLPQTDILLPQKSQVLQRLITTLTKLGRSNEALVYAKTLSDANPQGAMLQDKFKQGIELFQAGKLDEAEPLLLEVYNESHNESVGTLLGMIRYAKKDLTGAVNYLSSNVDPEVASESAMATLAASQLQLSQPEKLLDLYNPEARAHIKSPELKTLVGIALLQTGATVEGEKLLAEAQSEQPENNAIRATLARYYLSNRQADKAISILESGLKAQTDDNLSRLLIIAYATANKPDQALASARQLAASTPPKAENSWVLGRTALQLQKLDIAEPALRSALALQPDLLPAQLDLALLQLRRKQAAPAEIMYKTILAQHADNIAAIQGLVAVAELKAMEAKATEAKAAGSNDTAPLLDAKTLEAQILAVVDTDNARAVLADYHLRHQQFDDAERLLKAIPGNEPNSYSTQLKQSLALANTARALQSRDYATARARVVEGLKTNPNNPQLLLLLARVEISAGKPEEAKKVATQLAQLQPQNPALLELQGDLAMLEKQPKIAAEHYRKVWEKFRNNGIATKLYQSLSQDKAAAEHFLDDWQHALPDSDTPWFMRGISLQLAGQRAAAITSYEAAVTRNASNAQALNNLAGLYQENNDARALPTAEKAYNLAKTEPAVIDTYGWLLVQSKQGARGLALLREAAVLAPASKEIQEHIRQAEATVGRGA